MQCLLAEKPSVARDMAQTLGTPQKHDGYLTVGSDWIITWAFGHLVTLAAPEAYDPSWKQWAWTTLPLIPPGGFQLVPIAKSLPQYKIVKSLFLRHDVTRIICATDADREGELIFRYIYRLSGSVKPVDRLWLSENTPQAIQKALANLKPATAYDALGQAAECRSQADWLVGLNATRAFTLRHGIPGQGALSVGRVQTPTLRLIGDRDQAIAAFQPVPYWQLAVTFQAPEGSYVGIWHRVHPDGTAPDHPDRIPTEAKAQRLQALVPAGTPGQIVAVDRKRVIRHPPLLFSLNDLQKEANRRFGLTAQQTLDGAQRLYEKHLTSYPRTDAQHLTTDVAATLTNRLQSLASLPLYRPWIAGLPQPLNTARIIDDKKVAQAGHYAIIPTGQTPPSLNEPEAQIFDLIVRRLLAALMPEGEDERTQLRTTAARQTFITQGTAILSAGWRTVMAGVPEGDPDKTPNKDEDPAIPAGLQSGEAVTVQDGEIRSKKTQPPSRLTDASLLALMEKHHLGTPATRGRILEVLLARDYIHREKKTLVSTEKGQALLQVVPDSVQSPDLTGQWEAQLEAIAQGTGSANDFMQGIRQYTQQIVSEAQGQPAQTIGSNLGSCPVCHQGQILSGKKAWGCSRWKEGCTFTIWKTVAGKTLTETQVKILLAGKTTGLLKGFRSKAGKPFTARLQLDPNGKVVFVFEKKKAAG